MDDESQIVLDGNDQKNIPILKDLMAEATKQAGNLRCFILSTQFFFIILYSSSETKHEFELL